MTLEAKQFYVLHG